MLVVKIEEELFVNFHSFFCLCYSRNVILTFNRKYYSSAQYYVVFPIKVKARFDVLLCEM